MHASASRMDRYLADGLPPRSGDRLRDHLRSCPGCRDRYDRQVILLRALAGGADGPTRQEDERMVLLALRAAGLTPEPEPGEQVRLPYLPVPAWAAAAVLLVVLALGLWLSLRPAAPGIVGQLIGARNATLDGLAADTSVFPRIPVREGETLAVEKGGMAELALSRGGTMRVYPRTALSVSGPGRRVDLGIGKVWCLVEPSGEPFVVRTDLAEARVVGTSFIVERERSGETEVRVVKGEVEVRNVGQQDRVRVRGGSRTRVAADRPPSPPRSYDPHDDESEWEAFLHELKKGFRRMFRDIQDLFDGD